MNQKTKNRLNKIKGFSLKKKIKKSLEILEQINTKKLSNTPLIVNFSGGKDSVAVLSLVKKITDNIECCYVDGGFDLPTTRPYVEKIAKKFNVKLVIPKCGEVKLCHKPDGPITDCQTFKDFILHYGYFPTSGNRWCSIWCKQRIMKSYWRSRFDKHIILYKLNGVRMFESPTRLWKYGDPKHYKKYSVDGSYFLRYDNEHHPCILGYPIIEWTTDNVLDYLDQENITLHSGYKEFGVSGCKWCPVHDKETYKKIMEKYPNIYDDFIDMEKKINKPAIQNKYWLSDLKKELEKQIIYKEKMIN